jgi:hypothetical protein
MPSEVTVVHAHEFVITTVRGQLDFAKSKVALMEVASAGVFSSGANVLLDIRDAPGRLTLPEVLSFADEFARVQTDHGHKTAVLIDPGRFENAEFFAVTAKNMGLQVQAFTSFEDAFEWLAL